jgi:hypothetical protein
MRRGSWNFGEMSICITQNDEMVFCMAAMIVMDVSCTTRSYLSRALTSLLC